MLCLDGEFGVSQHRPAQRDHVAHAIGQQLLRQLRRVDAVGCHHRCIDGFAQARHGEAPGATRHHVADGRHTRFMPADTGIEQIDAGGAQQSRLGNDFIAGQATVDQIEGREPEGQQEVAAQGFTRAAHDLQRKAHAVFERTAPAIAAGVGAGRGELGDEVTLRAHDLHTVIASLLRQLRATHEVVDALIGFAVTQGTDAALVDGRGHIGRADRIIVNPCVTTGMQDLQQHLGLMRMHRFNNGAVLMQLIGAQQCTGILFHLAPGIGRVAASDDECRTAFGTLAIERGLALRSVWL